MAQSGVYLSKNSRATTISSAPKTRTLHSRPPLCRFQEIFHAIKTGRYPNRTQLAETIEVTSKTIQRDIDYMRYQMSVPIEFDFARKDSGVGEPQEIGYRPDDVLYD
jgi:hypothetical protein